MVVMGRHAPQQFAPGDPQVPRSSLYRLLLEHPAHRARCSGACHQLPCSMFDVPCTVAHGERERCDSLESRARSITLTR